MGAEGRTNPQVDDIKSPIVVDASFFSQGEALHNEIDSWTPPSTLRVIELAGWGLNTVASFEYSPLCVSVVNFQCVYVLDQQPRETIDGDGTVVVPAAQYMSSDGKAEKYWVDLFKYNSSSSTNNKHVNILEVLDIQKFIGQVLENESNLTSNNITDTQPANFSNLIRLSIHSPVEIEAYDGDGNRTGKTCQQGSDFCFTEEEIPNSSYMEFGEGKYISLPENNFGKVKLRGTGLGTFTYRSEKILPDGASTVSSFVDIPVTTQTQGEVVLDQATGAPQLRLDVTGDGVMDMVFAPNQAFNPTAYLRVLKNTVDSIDLTQEQKVAFADRVEGVIKAIRAGTIDTAKLVPENFKYAFDKPLTPLDPGSTTPKKLSKEDSQLLLDMLNKLLDNLTI